MDIKIVDCKYKLSLLNNKNDCINVVTTKTHIFKTIYNII